MPKSPEFFSNSQGQELKPRFNLEDPKTIVPNLQGRIDVPLSRKVTAQLA